MEPKELMEPTESMLKADKREAEEPSAAHSGDAAPPPSFGSRSSLHVSFSLLHLWGRNRFTTAQICSLIGFSAMFGGIKWKLMFW